MIASLDLGYGYVKALREDGRRVCFPSVVAEAPRSLGLSAVASTNTEGHRL